MATIHESVYMSCVEYTKRTEHLNCEPKPLDERTLALLEFRNYAIQVIAEMNKKKAQQEAEAAGILEAWKANKQRDEIRIAAINNEAALRDAMQMAQLEADAKKKKAEELKKKRQVERQVKKSQREWAEMRKAFRKDMRERNKVHATISAPTKAYRVEKTQRGSPAIKRELPRAAKAVSPFGRRQKATSVD